MTSKAELCRKLIEAREKSAQGEWFSNKRTKWGYLYIRDGRGSYTGLPTLQSGTELLVSTIENTDFVAFAANHAADIAKWALELAEQNRKMRVALEIVSENGEIAGINADTIVARLALAEVKE